MDTPTHHVICESALRRMASDRDAALTSIETGQMSPKDFSVHQTRYLLNKFFLEQIPYGRDSNETSESDPLPNGKLQVILDRDFNGLEGLRRQWLELASDQSTQWIVAGLSFASFTFHLFPISSEHEGVPFCVSPIFVSCVCDTIYDDRGLSLLESHTAQFDSTLWRVVSNRIACLEKPLELLGAEPDCQAGACDAP